MRDIFDEIRAAGWKKIVISAAFYALVIIFSFAIGKAFSVSFFEKKEIISPLMAAIIGVSYFLIIAMAYSFLKLGILQIASKKKISRTTFSKLGGFFLFNSVIVLLSLIIFALAGSFITYSLNDSVIAGSIFLVVFLIFFYPFLMFAQIEFIENGKIFRSAKEGFKQVFSRRIGKYLKLIAFNIIAIAAYFLIFFLIGNLYRLAFVTDNQNAGPYISLYNILFNLLLIILIFILLGFNSFYLKRIKG